MGPSSSDTVGALFFGFLNLDENEARLDLRRPAPLIEGRFEPQLDSAVAEDPSLLALFLSLQDEPRRDFSEVRLNLRKGSVIGIADDCSAAHVAAMMGNYHLIWSARLETVT